MRLELILTRERSFAPRSRIDITTFGEWEVQNGFKVRCGCDSSPGRVLHPLPLALHTNLAIDVAKLGVCVACTRGEDTEAHTGWTFAQTQNLITLIHDEWDSVFPIFSQNVPHEIARSRMHSSDHPAFPPNTLRVTAI